MKFHARVLLVNISRKFKVHLNLTRKPGNLHEVNGTFMIITRSVLLSMRNDSDKSFRENKKKWWSIFFFPWKSCHLLVDVEKYCEAGQATVDSLGHTHCTLHTSSYKHTLRICRLILIAFPLQQWSHKFTSMLHLHIQCLLVIFQCFLRPHTHKKWLKC